MKMHLQMLSGKWWPFYPGQDQLKQINTNCDGIGLLGQFPVISDDPSPIAVTDIPEKWPIHQIKHLIKVWDELYSWK